MKHGIAAILACLYLLLSSGLAVNSHFCCDKIVATSIAPFIKTCCPDELKTAVPPNSFSEKSCCSDVLVMADCDDNRVPTTIEFPSLILDVPLVYDPGDVLYQSTMPLPEKISKDPPDRLGKPAYLLFCSFVHYG
jgi:hypothetical protein